MALPFSYLPVYSLIFLFLLSFSSCKKEEAAVNTHRIDTGTEQDLKAIAVAGTDTIYVAGGEKDKGIILRSTDGGSTFSIVSQLPYAINALEIAGNGVYAAGDSFNLFYSPNGGTDWTEIWLINSPSLEYQTHLKDVEVKGSKVFFCGGWNLGRGVIGRSLDNGINWNYTVVEHELLSIKMMDDLHGICMGNGVILTTDDGADTWQLHDAQDEFWTGLSVNHSMVACSFGGKIIQSDTKGTSWKTLYKDRGMISSGILTIASSINELFAAGINGKGVYSSNGGADWKKVNGFEDSHIYAAIYYKASEGYAVGENGKLFRFSFR